MNTNVRIAGIILASVCLIGATKPTPSATKSAAVPTECSPSTTTSTVSPDVIIGQQAALSKGLTSYEVPIDISTKIHVVVASLPVKFSGTQYFQAPNRVGVQVKKVSKQVGGLIGAIESLAALQVPFKTSTFEIDTSHIKTDTNPDCSKDYELDGTLKVSKTDVRGIVFKVNAKTYVIDSASLTYANGGTLAATYAYKTVKGTKNSYYLLSKMSLSGQMQTYKGNADVDYSDYKLNGSIPASAFSQ